MQDMEYEYRAVLLEAFRLAMSLEDLSDHVKRQIQSRECRILYGPSKFSPEVGFIKGGSSKLLSISISIALHSRPEKRSIILQAKLTPIVS